MADSKQRRIFEDSKIYGVKEKQDTFNMINLKTLTKEDETHESRSTTKAYGGCKNLLLLTIKVIFAETATGGIL